MRSSLDESNQFYSVSTTPVDDGNGFLIGRILKIRNITIQKRHQYSLETLAFNDPLTMVANRRKFQEEFAKTVEGSIKDGSSFAILYFDLNRFKEVNDKLGHDIGDELLKFVAARIASILRSPDILARFGGDEFAAILHNADEKAVRKAVNRILLNTKKPFRIEDNILVAELSVGAAFYPQHGENLIELLRNADTAMYQSKSNGGGLTIFNSNINSQSFSET